MWTIPAEREAIEGIKHSQRGSKMCTPHLVPLSCQALAIIKQVYKLSGDRDFVFIDDHGHRKRMNENTVNKMLGSMDDDTKIDMGLGQCSIIL